MSFHFFIYVSSMTSFTQIASLINSEIVGHDLTISGIEEPEKATGHEVIFIIQHQALRNKTNFHSKAWIISQGLISAELEDFLVCSQINYIIVQDVYEAFVKVLQLFHPESKNTPLIHQTAIKDKTTILGDEIHLGAHCFIGSHSQLGNRVTVMAHSYIGSNVFIDENTLIYPNVTIYNNSVIGRNVIIHAGTVIGSDGFGFYKKNGLHMKIPHVGKVVIEDDVEIGANCAIDRGSLGETRIRRGSKLDNLVQIAHNVVIGENTLIAAQSGIAGSTKIGDNVTIAGQVGIVGHVRIGNGVTIGAQAGVISSVEDGKTISGYPARDHAESLRKEAYIRKIPEILKILKQKTDE